MEEDENLGHNEQQLVHLKIDHCQTPIKKVLCNIKTR